MGSCYSPSPKPEGLIGEAKMEKILFDIYLYRHQNLEIDNFQSAFKKSEVTPKILEKHKVSFEEFENSLVYYSIRPKRYMKMLTSLLETVENTKEEVEKTMERKNQVERNDSLKKTQKRNDTLKKNKAIRKDSI